MNLLVLIFTLVFSCFSQASPLSFYEGEYAFSDNLNSSISIEADRGTRLVLHFNRGVNKAVRGEAFVFECDLLNYTCINDRVANFSVKLALLEGDNIAIQATDLLSDEKGATGNILVPKVNSSTSTTKGVWSFGIRTENGGLELAHATVGEKGGAVAFELVCPIATQDISMQITLNNTIWNALAYASEINGEKIRIRMLVGEKVFVLSQWSLEKANMIVRLGDVPVDEIELLKSKNRVGFQFFTVASDGQVIDFEDLVFSLSNSGKSISLLQEACGL